MRPFGSWDRRNIELVRFTTGFWTHLPFTFSQVNINSLLLIHHTRKSDTERNSANSAALVQPTCIYLEPKVLIKRRWYVPVQPTGIVRLLSTFISLYKVEAAILLLPKSPEDLNLSANNLGSNFKGYEPWRPIACLIFLLNSEPILISLITKLNSTWGVCR